MSFSGSSFSKKGFHFVANPGEKVLANISGQYPSFNISGEIKEAELKTTENQPPQLNLTFTTVYNNSFNQAITANQSIFQNYSIQNILNFANQQNIMSESKAMLQSQIKDFEQECNKSNPDHAKLKSILNFALPIAKDLGLMLFKHMLDKGHIISLN